MSIHAVNRPCGVCGALPDPATYRRIWHRPTPQGDMDLCDACENSHPELQRPMGLLCSFDKHQSMAEVLVCPDCIAFKTARAQHTQMHETIDPTQPYGQHIALTCVNHPELRWNTKNIGYIGARSIFFSGDDPRDECDCPARDLRVAK